ncbi:unnamed protein product [Urochloa humidicola]
MAGVEGKQPAAGARVGQLAAAPGQGGAACGGWRRRGALLAASAPLGEGRRSTQRWAASGAPRGGAWLGRPKATTARMAGGVGGRPGRCCRIGRPRVHLAVQIVWWRGGGGKGEEREEEVD